MATPYAEQVGALISRLRRETRSAADVEQIIDEIDWYRVMIRDDMLKVEQNPGLTEGGFQGKRSQLAKLERNDNALASLRMEAMDLKKEREKLDVEYEETKRVRERAVVAREEAIARGKVRLQTATEAAEAKGITEDERKARAEELRRTKAEQDAEQRAIETSMKKLRDKMNRWN